MQITTAGRWFVDEGSSALPIAAVGALLAASLLYTPVPLVLLAGIPLCFYFMTRPYELLLVMVFLIPFNFVIPVGPVPIAAELLKVFAWVPFLLHRERSTTSFKTSRYTKWFAVWAGIFVLSVFRSNDLPYTIKESVRFASNIGLCLLVLNLVDTREKLVQVLKVLVVSTFLVACYGFYQLVIGDFGALFWIVNPRLETSFSHGRVAFWEWRNRLISVLTSEMEMGHYFNLCLPVGLALWITQGRKQVTSKWLWMTVATLVGLLLTFTFGAWLALLAAVGLSVVLLDKKRRWKVVLVAAIVFSLVAAIVILGPLREVVEPKLFGSDMGSIAWDAFTRMSMWTFALKTWWAHPILGVGIGNYELLYSYEPQVQAEWASQGASPHETFLYLLVQGGIIGLVAVLRVMLGNIRGCLSLRNTPELGPIAFALGFALMTNMIGWFSDDSGFFGPHASYLVWLFLGLSEVIRNLAQPQTAIAAA
jgi:O-antigen ligase